MVSPPSIVILFHITAQSWLPWPIASQVINLPGLHLPSPHFKKSKPVSLLLPSWSFLILLFYSNFIVMRQNTALVQFWAKVADQSPISVKNLKGLSSILVLMTWNYLLWYKLWNTEVTIFFIMNLFYSPIMMFCIIWVVRIKFQHVMPRGMLLCNNLHSLSNIKLEFQIG